MRAVRAGQCGSLGNYIDNGDGTITDTGTGLMWQKDTAPGRYTWQEALSYCETSTLAGYNDWRLPNRNELQSIVDYGSNNPSINTTYFSGTEPSSYWSSTTYAINPISAWSVSFDDGNISHFFKPSHLCVRAVRAGECGSLVPSTTTTMRAQPCPTEQIYGEHSAQTELLRYLRDNVLSTTPEGRELISLYYQWSPVIVEIMEGDTEFKAQVKEMIDGALLLIREVVE